MISSDSTILIVIDFQDNLFQVMQDKENLLANAAKVIKGAKVFDMPIIVTEQSPEKLGPTMPELARELSGSETIGKENFSSWANNKFQEKLKSSDRRQAIIMGIECHVCVYQTVLDLIDNGYSVHVVADAVSSRTSENKQIALQRMLQNGSTITSTEMCVYELLGKAGTEEFKATLQLVK